MHPAMSMTRTDHDELLQALRFDAKHFGPELATEAFARGLAVTDQSDGATKPIPITATPIIIDEVELRRRQRVAALLSSATLKMSRAVLGGLQRDTVYQGLSPLEQMMADATAQQLSTLVTTRVDFFAGAEFKALEVNATIPAMQGYSDIAANTFLEVVGRFWRVPEKLIAGWQATNGSNALALYRALMGGYAQVRPGRIPDRIALLCRRNDAQLTEQQYLRDRFRDLGADADIVHPDQLSGDDAVRANGKTYDLIYRHLFVRRLEEPGLEGASYVRQLLAEPNGTRAVVLNPPASHVEAKAVFALLSEALENTELAHAAELSPLELEAIDATVPWTRLFRSQALRDQVALDPDAYVLKRSWDYGGRTVFVGRTRHEASFADRVKAAYSETFNWNELCSRALSDARGGGFVVQQVVDIQPENHVLCSASAQESVDLYVDFSAYASVGLPNQPAWGGVCRGSLSHIVNIVGGGGVLPLVTSDVAQRLLTAWRAWVK